MKIIFFAYTIGALFVALRLVWHMLFKLDHFDWHYCKGDIWGTLVISTLLWPLMFIKPKFMINPNKLFEGNYGIASRMRERYRLLENPPPIGPVIRYRQYSQIADTYGEFLFRTTDVECVLREAIQKNPKRSLSNVEAILHWMRNYDEKLEQPTDMPEAWSEFQYFANNLVRAGYGKIRCLKCDEFCDRDEIVIKVAGAKPGWNSDLITCPHGHNLLIVRRSHIISKASPDISE